MGLIPTTLNSSPTILVHVAVVALAGAQKGKSYVPKTVLSNCKHCWFSVTMTAHYHTLLSPPLSDSGHIIDSCHKTNNSWQHGSLDL